MAHCLPMATDRADIRGIFAAAAQQLGDGGGVAPGKFVAQTRTAVDFVFAGGIEREELAAQRLIESVMHTRQQARRGCCIDKHRVHPVEAGARHYADVERRVHSACGAFTHSSWARVPLASRSSCAASGAACAWKAGRSCAAMGAAAGMAIENGLRASPAMRNS